MVLTIISLLLLLAYCWLILYFRFAWTLIPEFKTVPGNLSLKVSVIIPARNEAHNIGNLLTALQQQTYPSSLIEIIVIDDHSTDHTATIVTEFSNIKLISLEADNINSYKKKAIETGIAASGGDWIICTDADCLPTSRWIETLMAYRLENDSIFVAAPVDLISDGSFAGLFQVVDFMVLQGFTGAGIATGTLSMCNGANLAYDKNVFKQVNGFNGIDQIASGDDLLLMNKMKEVSPGRVHYVKSSDAIMQTPVMPSWKAFFNQRIRWASKSRYYNDKKLQLVLLLVYLFNVLFMILAIAACISLKYLYVLIAVLAIKTCVEYVFVHTLSRFFSHNISLFQFFIFQPAHIVYIIASGFFSQIGKYEWKGRKVK